MVKRPAEKIRPCADGSDEPQTKEQMRGDVRPIVIDEVAIVKKGLKV
jgi:hypothetical protein